MTREKFLEAWIKVTKNEHVKFYRKMGPYRNIFTWYVVRFKNAVHSMNPITAVYFFKRHEKIFYNQYQVDTAGKKLGLDKRDIRIIQAATRRDYSKLSSRSRKIAEELRKEMVKYCHKSKSIHQNPKEIPDAERRQREEKEQNQKDSRREKNRKKRHHRGDRRKKRSE